jgi:hypothetical protein
METLTRTHSDPQRAGDQLLDLAWALSSDGLDGHEGSIRQVVTAARAAGVSPVVVGVLADPSEPEVARLRAFGQVVTALARSGDQVHDIAA